MNILVLVLAAILTYLLVYTSRHIYDFAKMAIRAKMLIKDIPGPPSLPLIGSAHLFKISSLDFTYQLEDWGRMYMVNDKVCGMVAAWIGPVPLVIIIAAEAVRPILESNINITKPAQYDIISEWIGTGLLTRFPWLWLKPIWYLTGLGLEFDKLVKLTNDFTRKVIVERKKVMEEEGMMDVPDDGKLKMAFLDLLIKMQKEKGLSDEDIREEVDTFMFEGHDTTSSGMGFTLWWIGQSPRVQEKVQEELDEIFGTSDRLITIDDVKKLVYLEKCVKEALRLLPSVPFIARRLESDQEIGDFTLPKGMTVVLTPVATHRDPRWYEFPDEFYPEHFDAEKTAKRDPYAYVPFSAGPRNCIGQKFAILEEKTVLATILRKFNVETKEPWPANRPVPEIILKPVVGFNVKLTPRQII